MDEQQTPHDRLVLAIREAVNAYYNKTGSAVTSVQIEWIHRQEVGGGYRLLGRVGVQTETIESF